MREYPVRKGVHPGRIECYPDDQPFWRPAEDPVRGGYPGHGGAADGRRRLGGAAGWVAVLLCPSPAETVAIFRLVKAGRIEEALAIYRWFLPVLELDIHSKLVQYIKLAEVQTGIGSEYVRAPRLPLTGQERERILQVIGECVASRPSLPDYLSIRPEKTFA